MPLDENAPPEADAPPGRPDEPPVDDPGTGRRRRPTWLWLATAVAVVAAVVTAVVVFDPFGPPSTDAAEEVVREASALLLGLDSADAEDIRPRLEAVAAGQFRDELDQAFTAGLGDVLAAADTEAEAEATRVFLDTSAAGSMSAISVSEVTRTGPELPEPTTFQVYLQLELLRVDGAWRVVEVTDLGVGRGGAPRPAPSDTTAPSPTSTPSGSSTE